MKQKEDIIQEGASALFNSENQTEPDNSRVHSQRKFFLTGRRGTEQKGGDKGEIRTSFMLNRKQYDKVREIAMREGMTIKDLVYYMLELAIDKYESKHGKVVVSREDKAKNLFI
jgi:hypothetical protein